MLDVSLQALTPKQDTSREVGEKPAPSIPRRVLTEVAQRMKLCLQISARLSEAMGTLSIHLEHWFHAQLWGTDRGCRDLLTSYARNFAISCFILDRVSIQPFAGTNVGPTWGSRALTVMMWSKQGMVKCAITFTVSSWFLRHSLCYSTLDARASFHTCIVSLRK